MSSLPDIEGGRNQLQTLQGTLDCATMPRLSRVMKDRVYDEKEAAAALGITVSRLHEVLDQHIFTAGNPRPQALQFTSLARRVTGQRLRPAPDRRP